MTASERLLAAFDDETLVRPSADALNLVDLARALASITGVPDVALTEGAREIASAIGEPRHLVFMLVDGLGANMLAAERGATFLNAHAERRLQTVFPATTSAALTSIATIEWPARHAVTGWWTHLPAIGAAATMLPYVRRSDDRPLAELGVTPEQAFPLPSVVARMARETLCVQPERIVNSVYSRYWFAGRASRGYRTLGGAVDAVIEHAQSASGPTYAYLYAPHIDIAAHAHGADGPEARAALLDVDRHAQRLAAALAGEGRLVLTADHGHLAARPEARHRIAEQDGLRERLECAPAGDPRVIHFHVRTGERERFRRDFDARFGRHFVLLTTDEVEQLELFGPGKLSDETRRRLGDFVAISLGADILGYQGPDAGSGEMLAQASHHSGLTPDEMHIPLVLA